MKRYPGQEFPAFLYVCFLSILADEFTSNAMRKNACILFSSYICKGTKKSWIMQIFWHFFSYIFQLFLPLFLGAQNTPFLTRLRLVGSEITAHSWRGYGSLKCGAQLSYCNIALHLLFEEAEKSKKEYNYSIYNWLLIYYMIFLINITYFFFLHHSQKWNAMQYCNITFLWE